MTRVDDLIDLMQTANDIYLVNPNRNVRMAYISIDDLCELAMKSFLQTHLPNWSPVSQSAQGRAYFKNFKTITGEVGNAHPGDQVLTDLSARIQDRRENRNRFFHDQDMARLTVTEDECLRAFQDLYLLMDVLFGTDYRSRLAASRIARIQIAVIRLKCEGFSVQRVYE